ENNMVNITAEINMPQKEYDRRIAAVFAKGPKNEIFLVHTGKVGGGRQGIGKKTFRAFYQGDQLINLVWPDGLETLDICIGNLNDNSLKFQIAHFVKEVDRFKKFAVDDEIIHGGITSTNDEPTFTPEFTGKRKNYVLNGTVESISYHGQVVGALRSELECNGFNTANDGYRDLFVTKDKKMLVLFEVKTDLTSSSIYASIGQLMYHSIMQEPLPKRVLVVPGRPSTQTKTVLKKLGIEILEYSWQDDIPIFNDLNKLKF
ncbi:MAG: hypothetical protein A2328_01115, partial [Bdellovibrionales bacterium RIFOXYB2_FULL_36_6]